MWSKAISVIPALGMLLLSTTTMADLNPERQAELLYLLQHDCGSCHGMRLSGGLGPSLQPERLQRWDSELLAATIMYGRPGTPMPPWRPFMTPQEALWLAQQLQLGSVSP